MREWRGSDKIIPEYSSASEKLDMDFVRVRKADGAIVNAAASDIQDLAAPVTRSGAFVRC